MPGVTAIININPPRSLVSVINTQLQGLTVSDANWEVRNYASQTAFESDMQASGIDWTATHDKIYVPSI